MTNNNTSNIFNDDFLKNRADDYMRSFDMPGLDQEEIAENVILVVRASFKIATLIVAFGIVGYLMYKFMWPIVEILLALWLPLALMLVLLTMMGIISMGTANDIWALFMKGAQGAKRSIDWAIAELKKMQADRKNSAKK